MKTTLYQLLGVAPTASIDEVKAAYARAIESADAGARDPNAAALLKQALEVLSDPLRRNAYDASLAAAASGVTPMQRRRDAGSASVMTPGAWMAIILAVAAMVGAGVWTLARRDLPKAVPLPIEQNTTTRAPATAIVAASAPATVAEADRVSVPVRPVEASASPARSAENVYADVASSVALVTVMDASDRTVASGSGVVIEPGIVLTSCHVAKVGTKVAVKFGALILPATVKLADEAFDLCRLTVTGLRAPPVKIGSVASLRTGQKVYAIGAPAGLELTISEGIVSSLRRIEEGTVIQTTAPISPGSSGGGLFDVEGRLVGIMTFQHRFGQNLNFALPADWIAQMRERGAGASGWRAAAASASTGGDRSGGLIFGEWLCRDWISGRAGSFKFDHDGRVVIAMADNPAVVMNYGMFGKALVVYSQNKGASLTINELSAKKMIMKGTDRSIACER